VIVQVKWNGVLKLSFSDQYIALCQQEDQLSQRDHATLRVMNSLLACPGGAIGSVAVHAAGLR